MNQLLDVAGNVLAVGDTVLASTFDGLYVAKISWYNPGNMYCSLQTVDHPSIRTEATKRFKLTGSRPTVSALAAGASIQTKRLLRFM